MVHVEKFKGRDTYVCDKCLLAYADRKTAERCEEHCTKFNACSLEIIKHAISKN